MGGLNSLIPRLAVCVAPGQRLTAFAHKTREILLSGFSKHAALGASKRSENHLVDHLSRDLDRVRDRRDALAFKRDAIASDVSTLTSQIAELETRIAKEKDRRERERAGDEIEEIKKRLEETATAFASTTATLRDATEAAATLVPEARELNGFLSSVETEVNTVIVSLLHELQRQTEAVSQGHAALCLPASVNEAPQQSKNDEGIGSCPGSGKNSKKALATLA